MYGLSENVWEKRDNYKWPTARPSYTVTEKKSDAIYKLVYKMKIVYSFQLS